MINTYIRHSIGRNDQLSFFVVHLFFNLNKMAKISEPDDKMYVYSGH
jgi:hypothetical protein